MNEEEIIGPIKSSDDLEKVLDQGYTIKGPRNDPEKDIAGFKVFLKKGKEFAPENWLEINGYQFVEPNIFTKGNRIAWKNIDDFPDERFNSQYKLVKGAKEVTLYLKKELPKME